MLLTSMPCTGSVQGPNVTSHGVSLARARLPQGQGHTVVPLQHGLHQPLGLLHHLIMTAVSCQHLRDQRSDPKRKTQLRTCCCRRLSSELVSNAVKVLAEHLIKPVLSCQHPRT